MVDMSQRAPRPYRLCAAHDGRVRPGEAAPPRHFVRAVWWGLPQRCPGCGTGQVSARSLKVCDLCPACGEALHHHRADDAPAYFTILLVGHFVVGGVLALERGLAPPTWV